MAVRFVMGGAGSGKTKTVLNEIVSRAAKNPEKTYLVIAPEQFNLRTQAQLTSLHPAGVILNIDVLSFERLSYRVFDEVGFKSADLLEEIGKIFVLQKVALDKVEELPVIGRRLNKPGALAEMKSVLSELAQYDIHPENLEKYLQTEKNSVMKAKITDILSVYRAYKAYLGDRFMTAEEVPDKLCEVIEDSTLLKGAVLVFDGFTGFTPVQMRLIGKMMMLSDEMIFTAVCDPGTNLFGECRKDHLFSMSTTMVSTIKALADEANVPVRPVEWVHENGGIRASKELDFLEKHFLRYDGKSYKETLSDIHLNASGNPFKETEDIARRIAYLVRTKGYRYRDIAVLTGDVEHYGSLLQLAFARRGIPCFVDQKRPLLNNPLVEAIRGAMDACVDNYSYEGIFRYLKSGMTDLTRDEINRLENHVLACGIRGKSAWRRTWVYRTGNETEDELDAINALREKVCAFMDPLSEKLAERGAAVREKAAALYRFCADNRMQERLLEREEQLKANGHPELASVYSQVYGKVMSILDKLVDVLGDEKMSQGAFCDMIETGLGTLRIGIIPQGHDQVLVGDMERSRLEHVKVLFLAGVNEGLVPKSSPEGGFLTEAERENLDSQGVKLRPSPREQAFIQNFYIYLALTKPDQELYLSYSLSGNDGGERHPAYLISVLQHLFPDLREEAPSEKLMDRIEQTADGLPVLSEGIRNLRDTIPGADWEEVYKWYASHETGRRAARMMLDGLKKDERYDGISRWAAERLYGVHARSSASRLELMTRCPFAHFISYGLQLKERSEYGFDPVDRGIILHDALYSCGKDVKSGEILPEELLDRDKRDSLAKDKINEVVGDNLYLQDNDRSAYEEERLSRFLSRSLWVLARQMKAGAFEIEELERKFGDDLIEASHLTLSDGSTISLSGRIDRIDVCDVNGHRYIKVIDYKTGQKEFDLAEAYHGLQLQLLLYMNAALELARKDHKEASVAGIFYQKIDDPMVDFKKAPTAETQQKALLKMLRGSGLVSSDPEVLRLFDENIAREGSSDVLNVRVKKNGEPYANSPAVSEEDFEILGRFAEKKARMLAEDIISGNIAAAPYRLKGKSGCEYCELRSLCRFDEQMPGCRCRYLRSGSNEEIIDRMQQELSEDKGEEV